MTTPAYVCRLDTPLGPATACAMDDALCGFWFIGQKYYPQAVRHWIEQPKYPVFPALRRWLDEYFAGAAPRPDFALTAQGTAFQKAVWDLLLHIPYGETTTYGELSKQLAALCNLPSMSAQAVGGAVGHNPISLLIPCHRVVGSTGKLTGYAGGLDKKEALLRLEKKQCLTKDNPPIFSGRRK